MSKLTKVISMLALVFYGMASMHCMLEGVPGLTFLQTCCFVEPGASTSADCATDECVVESADYRAGEQGMAEFQSMTVLALLSSVLEAPLPDPPATEVIASESPPDLPTTWQFSYRTALPSRAPSIAS